MDYNLTISLSAQNSLQVKYNSIFLTQLTTESKLTLIIDSGNEATIKSSNVNTISASVSDSCGSTCRPDYN